MARKWSYWTKNKLQILNDYVPAFNRASQKSSERVYLDLMAGRPENVERYTGQKIDGSPRRVLAAEPGFTQHVFFELPGKAARLDAALREQFPDKRFRVVPGDCNTTIDEALYSLRAYSAAPTFAFIDQQAAEVWWETIVKISRFKGSDPRTKPELWLLMSPTMIVKGARGTNNTAFRDRVTRLYGTSNWLNFQEARETNTITPDQYREEMTNLIRYRLAEELGYKFTHRIPMRMENGATIYDMVFATDHYVGDKIMRHVYKKAAEREPAMRAEARRLAKMNKERETGREGLFEIPTSAEPDVSGEILWRPTPYWLPTDREWWKERD